MTRTQQRHASWGLERGDEIVPGRYAEELLGGGNRFEAYVAWDERLHTTVVAKIVRPDLVDDDVVRKALAAEVRALRRVAHPSIVRSFDAVLDGDRPHVVLEHLEGPRMSTLLRRYGAFPLEQLLPLALQITSALHYLREIDLLHLDVKPKNIVMTGPPRLIDLSVARSTAEAQAIRKPVGTRTYMAPEQCEPGTRGGIGPAADVWGLGAVLYEAASGRPAFPRDGAEHPQIEMRPAPLDERIPRPVSELVAACLEPDPPDRPTPAEVADRLGELIGYLPTKIVLSRMRPGIR